MGLDWGESYIVNPDIKNHKVKKKKMHNAANSQKSYMCSTPPAFYTVPNELGGLIASWSFVKWLNFDNLVVQSVGYWRLCTFTFILIFNPKWDMHWLRTKQDREWLAPKTCPQISGFSYGSSECHATVLQIEYQAMFVTASK